MQEATAVEDVKAILGNWGGDHALPGVLYRDPEVYETEVRRIFMRSWLYVGHQSQVPGRGDYFLFEIAGESVIVIRDAEGGINAMMNVCRHRGSRICDQPTGHESRLVCRYHGWTYGLDGGLRAAVACRRLRPVALGLRRAACTGIHGAHLRQLRRRAAGFRADRAGSRRAAPALWPRPCEGRSPPELSDHLELEARDRKLLRVLSLRTGAPRILGSAWTGGPVEADGSHAGGVMAARARVGLTQHTIRRSWLASGDLGVDRGFDRYPLLRGHLTGSRDGKPVAPLLGIDHRVRRRHDRPASGPDDLRLAYCDHVVLYRFTPRAPFLTDCEITWLVNESAREGTDYDGGADLALGRHDDRGQDDHRAEPGRRGFRFYVPGPLSPMEDFTRRFLQWYAAIMRETWPPRADRPADERGFPPHDALPARYRG